MASIKPVQHFLARDAPPVVVPADVPQRDVPPGAVSQLQFQPLFADGHSQDFKGFRLAVPPLDVNGIWAAWIIHIRRLRREALMGTETITVPRPKPDEVVLAATDADGAICWITVPKKDLAQDGDLLAQLVPFLAEGQRVLHEQRESAPAGS
jgi:hypothetical protein